MKIAGVAWWIWGVGALVFVGAAIAAMESFSSRSPASWNQEQSLSEVDLLARAYFDCIQQEEIPDYDPQGRKEKEAMKLPLGDRRQIEDREQQKKEKAMILFTQMTKAEADLEQAEKKYGPKYLKWLRNYRGALIARASSVQFAKYYGDMPELEPASAEAAYREIAKMRFEEAVEFGKSLSSAKRE